ncbi:Mobile element protein [hydrothermal vent metagenome]|uniref:Mobile element protein n=1 Tax=hydrothermal vent metagenome TaxID=652676 RepID=A0A3B0Y672_9ZZZZ
MKEPIVSDFSALVGIDWADTKHDVCELIPSTQKMKFSVISSKPEALNDWALSLKKRHPGKQIAVACELKKGPLIYALS